MGFKLEKVTVHTLATRNEVLEAARRLDGLGGSECEREERKSRSAKILECIAGKEMLPFHWAVGHVKDGIARRVDGQHSSRVFLNMTDEDWRKVAFPVVVLWVDYVVDAMEDLSILFEQFNVAWSNRSKIDVIGAHLGIYSDLSDREIIRPPVMEKVTAGIMWYRAKVEKVRSEQFAPIHEPDMHQFLIWCASFMGGKTRELMVRPVVAAIYHTSSNATLDNWSREFWKRVASGKSGNEPETIEYRLSSFLEDCGDKKTEWPRAAAKHFRKGAVSPSELDMFASCLRAHHAALQNKKVGDIYTPAGDSSADAIAAKYERLSHAA